MLDQRLEGAHGNGVTRHRLLMAPHPFLMVLVGLPRPFLMALIGDIELPIPRAA